MLSFEFYLFNFIRKYKLRGAWVAQSIKHLTLVLAQVLISSPSRSPFKKKKERREKIQIKTTTRCHYIPTSIAKNKQKTKTVSARLLKSSCLSHTVFMGMHNNTMTLENVLAVCINIKGEYAVSI